MAELTTKFGAPTNFYVAEAEFESNQGFHGEAKTWYCKYDTGVFVTNSPQPAGADSKSFGQLPSRITTTNKDKRTHGGLNMYTPNSGTDSFGLICVSNLMDAKKMSVSFRFSDVEWASNMTYNASTKYSIPSRYISSQTNSLWIRKTEVAFPTRYFETGYGEKTGEIVYATGLSLFDGDINLQSIIIARVVDFDGSGYPSMRKYQGVPYCDNGSIVFTRDGVIRGTIEGDNLSTLTGKDIVQAIPDKAMVGNGGIAALSCMAKGASTAVWLSHKNGIYKLYQGTTPLIGMPGDKVTIKGHEFACLAYGPFYIRMS